MAKKSYWEERSINTILQSEMSVLEFEQKMNKVYDLAIIEIRKEIDAFFGKYALENKITYVDARKRLSTIDVRTFKKQLELWYEAATRLNMPIEYRNYIKLLANRVYISRLEHLEASVRFEAEKLAATQATNMKQLVEMNYLVAYYQTAYNVTSGIRAEVNFASVSSNALTNAVKTRWEGGNYSDRVGYDKIKLVAALEKLIPQAFARGLSSNQIGDMIAKEIDISRRRGRRLARTEINYLANQAALDVYKIAGLLEYEYLATLDTRTSETCRGLDGEIFKVSQAEVGINYPPMHPNCRSTTIPYLPDEEDIEDRVARDEYGSTIKVPRKMTQEEWINKYVPKEQREILLRFKNKYKN